MIAAVTGVLAPPVMFVASMSFVVAFLLALSAWLAAVAVFLDRGATLVTKSLAAVGALGGTVAVSLFVMPFFFQN